MKNQELLSSIDRSSDRTTERTTDRPSYTDRNSYSRDQNSTGSVASITSTTRDRGLDKTNKISPSVSVHFFHYSFASCVLFKTCQGKLQLILLINYN